MHKKYGLYIFEIVLLLCLILSLAQPTLALSVSDFFSFKYSASFSTSSVLENSTFSVTITGAAVCIKDLTSPFNMVSEAKITGGIVAVNQSTGASIPLDSSYVLDIHPFPKKSGESAQASQTLALQFPSDTPPGLYTLEGRLIEAKVLAIFWLTITQYLPASISLGTVSYGSISPTSPPPSPAPSPTSTSTSTPAAPPFSAASPYPSLPVEVTPRNIEVPPAATSTTSPPQNSTSPSAAIYTPDPFKTSIAPLSSSAPLSPSSNQVSGFDPHPLNWKLIGGISVVIIMLIVSFWIVRTRRTR